MKNLPSIQGKDSLSFIFLLLVFSTVVACLIQTANASNGQDSALGKETNEEQSAESVHRRGLVSVDVSYNAVLQESGRISQNATLHRSSQVTLAYITPWNAKGYQIAKTYPNKFQLLSPVWFQVSGGKKNRFQLIGYSNIDTNWIREVRRLNPNVKIVPRIEFLHKWGQDDFTTFFKDQKDFEHIKNIVKQVIATVMKFDLDGIVLEWGYLKMKMYENILHKLAKRMGTKLHKKNKLFVVVVPAPLFFSFEETKHEYFEQSVPITSADFAALEPHVDYFSVMTYDYSNILLQRLYLMKQNNIPLPSEEALKQFVGPMAPILWCEGTILYLIGKCQDPNQASKKILMGLNFYGNDYSIVEGNSAQSIPNPIIGERYLQLIKAYRPEIQWNDPAKEHFFQYNDDVGGKHTVYYPSLKSLQERIDLAKTYQCGVSIWEAGQGLDYFYDLL